MKYVLALDQGTTSSRAALVDENQCIVSILSREFPQIYPEEGWVEHDPMDIWSSQYGVMMEVVAKSGVAPEDIAAIGITNQRETTIVWDRETGRPVYNAIVWQCRRTAPIIADLEKRGYKRKIIEKTGLIPDAYFSGSKIKWILDHTEGARERARRGELPLRTIPPQHADRAHARVFRRLHVGIAVADKYRLGGRNAQLAKHLQGEGRIGFDGYARAVAGDGVESVLFEESIPQNVRRRLRLIGDDGKFQSRAFQREEAVLLPRKLPGILVFAVNVNIAVMCIKLVDGIPFFGRKRGEREVPAAVADERHRLFPRDGRVTVIGESRVHAGVQVGKSIQNRSVQIEYDRF